MNSTSREDFIERHVVSNEPDFAIAYRKFIEWAGSSLKSEPSYVGSQHLTDEISRALEWRVNFKFESEADAKLLDEYLQRNGGKL